MFVNQTMLILAHTAQIMATLSAKAISGVPENNSIQINVTTTTLSPEEKENVFDFDDKWYMWRCYEPYGCFYIGSPWSGEHRPVSTFPDRPDSINPRYLLYIREIIEQPQELKIDKDETIHDSALKKQNNLYLIVHGFLDNGDKTWVMRTMKELLEKEDCNVVIVNWIAGAGPPYTQAVANTRLIGAMTARLVYQLIEIGGINPLKMHCIGHSLGAHTCGYIGYTLRKRYKYNLGRITGLDPAEPHFSNTSTMVRLDPTDATFVTAIHTDCNPFINLGLGITHPVAHIDFFPNGGRNQPGCNEGVLNSITLERGSFFRGIKRFVGCNHIRSYEYFIESINTKCSFLGVPCSSWEKFQDGNCFDCVNQYCPKLGLDAQPGNYHASVYLMTGSTKPFCKDHYKITINISKTNESLNHGGEVGTFAVKIFGEGGKKTEEMLLSSHSKYYEPGSIHTVVLPGNVVGKPEAVKIMWEYQASFFNPLTWRLLHTPCVYIDSLRIDSLVAAHGMRRKKQRIIEDKRASILLFVALVPIICSAGVLDPWQWARSDRIEVNIPWLPFENETRCYDELGCLNITRNWYHLIHRPLNVFPLPREVINTRFILYTNENLIEGQVLTVAKDKLIKRSNFNSKRKTKFIIHGFIDTPLSNWVKEMRNELLKHDDYNVIIVDWAGGSLPLYTQATANTRLVGLEIAHLIKHLQTNYGLDPNDVHLIGHSLGAHTAGYAGEKMGGSIGRITGLDPAEPYFQGMPNHLRLDYTDAKLVDVIHTDGKSIFFLGLPGYGMSQPCGHLDFYPNNGKEQPGCTDLSETTPSLPLTLIKEGLEEASRVLVACNHVRAIKLFIESINSKCQYVAHECSSYASFLRGECFSCKSNNSLSCGIMGYHADISPALIGRQAIGQNLLSLLGSKFFFTTGKEDPYCRKHYRITINLAQPSSAESWVQGFMKVTFHAENGIIRDVDLTPSGYMKLEHGSTVRMVIAHPAGTSTSLGKIRRVELSWTYDMDVLQPRSLCFFWCNDRLYVNSVTVDVMELPGRGKREADITSKLCSANKKEYAEIASGSIASFIDNC